jgi:hypothetical protein
MGGLNNIIYAFKKTCMKLHHPPKKEDEGIYVFAEQVHEVAENKLAPANKNQKA